MLAPLAARVDQGLKTGQAMDQIVTPLVNEGSLRISSRHLLPPDLLLATVNPNHVPSMAVSHVIYVAPFYVAHTPEVFAEQTHAQKFMQPEVAPAKFSEPSKEANPSQDRRRDHEMSH